jgi:hypothetical protein
MTEVWIVNGHLPECAYLRSLDKPWEAEDECDCRTDDEGDLVDEDEWWWER